MTAYRCCRGFISLTLVCGLFSLPTLVEVAAGAQRLRPPKSLQCPRNNLTAFAGSVLSFQREADQAVIRLRTDESTTEEFTLRVQEGGDLTAWFLLKAKPFRPDDWGLIELAPNHLRPDMRAIVWACDNGTSPVIDWRPSESSRPPRHK